MNQKQLEKLAGSGYISLLRDDKRIESITVKKTRGLVTYKADPRQARSINKKHPKKVVRKGD